MDFIDLIFSNFCSSLHYLGRNPAPGVCLPIIVKFCENAPYNFTVFPNYIGHFGQLDADEVSRFLLFIIYFVRWSCLSGDEAMKEKVLCFILAYDSLKMYMQQWYKRSFVILVSLPLRLETLKKCIVVSLVQ